MLYAFGTAGVLEGNTDKRKPPQSFLIREVFFYVSLPVILCVRTFPYSSTLEYPPDSRASPVAFKESLLPSP